MAEPTGRLSIAFDDDPLVWVPTWTRIDSTPNLVASYTIDRGRQYEFDHTDVGRATVSINDVDGILDPTNPSGPYYTKIEPYKQAAIARWNPVVDQWFTRYRGYIEDFSYDFDPSQKVNRLTVSLVDLQELLSAIEMTPGFFGIDTSGTVAAGTIGFPIQTMRERIEAVLGDAGIPDEFSVTFTGNVELHSNPTYSPGESVMTVIQDAVDAELPVVSNAYVDRFGRICAHGRLAKFDPIGTAASTTPDLWDFNQYTVGDGAYVEAHPSTVAHIRAFGFQRGMSKVYNSALATPVGIADENIGGSGPPITVGGLKTQGQRWWDETSIGLRGWRSWSAQNLLTRRGIYDGGASHTDDLTETGYFAQFVVANYAEPRERIIAISFRSLRPTDPRAAANWLLLSKIDIADLVKVKIGSPGGGGFNLDEYFVEGIHEQVRPLNANYDDVTLSLDLSPRAYFTDTSMFTPG